MDPASSATTATDGMRGYTNHTTWRDSTGELLHGEPVGFDADGALEYRVRYDGGEWIDGEYTDEVIRNGGWFRMPPFDERGDNDTD